MTPETRAKLEKSLNEHGLTVHLTRDIGAIMLQLARLAQFERLMHSVAAGNPAVEVAVEHVIREQRRCADHTPPDRRPLEVLDIPEVMTGLNRALHAKLGKQADISPVRLDAAIAAFCGVLCAEVRQ